MMTDATELKPRRIVLSRELLVAGAALEARPKQVFSQFLSRIRRGVDYVFLPLTGASDYERVVLAEVGLNVVAKRADDVVLLLWVGSEDGAARWAGAHRCEKNPRTGALQIWQTAPAPAADEVQPAREAEIPKVAGGAADETEEPAVGGAEIKETKETEEAKEASEASGAVPAAPTAPEKTEEGGAEEAAAPLFAALTDADLLDAGLPESMLAEVRALTSAERFEAMQKRLPDAVYEALTWFLQGESWAAVREAYGVGASSAETNVESALGGLDPGHFRVVESDDELRGIMERPLEEWRVFLHPSQLEIVQKPWHGAVRVTGGAGTGKTVVALHRAAHLVRLPDWTPKDRLLFTTFTKNLAVDLEWQLKTLCTKEEMRRIQVMNIDAWLATFIRQHGAGKSIAYPGTPAYEDCWSRALEKTPLDPDLPESFYRSEWEEVVLPNRCHDGREYLFAPRAGRGRALKRTERKAVWPVFQEMRLQMQLRDLMTVEDAADFAVETIRSTHPEGLYRAVVADEIQDFRPGMLRLLRALALDVSAMEKPIEGDLFMVGDPHQRIYAKPVAFSACGISIRGRRSRKLRVNYRTTDEIRKTAESVYGKTGVDDLEGGVAEKTGFASLRHGRVPEVFRAAMSDEEIRWIAARAKALSKDGGGPFEPAEMCVVLRTNDEAKRIAEGLSKEGLKVHMVSRHRADNPDDRGLRVATMHRVKGLEFKVVFVAGMTEGIFPMPAPQGADAPQKRLHERMEKALFYVAASRASQLLFFTCSGRPSRFLPVKA